MDKAKRIDELRAAIAAERAAPDRPSCVERALERELEALIEESRGE